VDTGACVCFFITSNDPVLLLPQFWSFAMVFTIEGHKSFSVDQLWNLIQAGLEQINKSTPSVRKRFGEMFKLLFRDKICSMCVKESRSELSL
jgi:hypothetical protein